MLNASEADAGKASPETFSPTLKGAGALLVLKTGGCRVVFNMCTSATGILNIPVTVKGSQLSNPADILLPIEYLTTGI